jgi:hypothetical protein
MTEPMRGSEVGDLLGVLIRNRRVSNMVDGASVGTESVNAGSLGHRSLAERVHVGRSHHLAGETCRGCRC